MFLNLCVSSLRRGHANLLCIVPILSDDPRRESTGQWVKKVLTLSQPPIQTCSHSRAKNLLLFSICACQPCAGAMLIFSVSFQFYRMIPKGKSTGQWAKKVLTLLPPAQHQWHGWPLTMDIPLLAFFRPQHLGASVPMYCSPQHCRLAAACHTCTCPRRESTLGSSIPLTILSWAEARVKIARMTLTIKLAGNWSSFQLANSAPPLSVTDSAIAPSARMFIQQLLTYALPKTSLYFSFRSCLQLSFTAPLHNPRLMQQQLEYKAPQKLWKSHWCVPFMATFSKRRKIGALWSKRCDDIGAQGSLSLVMHLCLCLLTLPLHQPSMAPTSIPYIYIYTYIFLLPNRVCCHSLSAMPA